MSCLRSAEGNEFLESGEAELPLHPLLRLQCIQMDLYHMLGQTLQRRQTDTHTEEEGDMTRRAGNGEWIGGRYRERETGQGGKEMVE